MKTLRELAGFGGVGGIAMLLHLSGVAALVPLGLNPLVANAIAFGLAFQWSYQGHRRWTFRAEGGSRSYRRMFALSLGSFGVNECAYGFLLQFDSIDYRLSLAVVLGAVSLLTYGGARFWVFGKRVPNP